MINLIHFEDRNSRRKLSISGNGWSIEKIGIEYICRHSCSGAILDEEDFEFKEGYLTSKDLFLSFSNSLKITLENLDHNFKNQFEFRNLKKLGIYRGNLNPEDLLLTNSFEQIPKFCINHWECEDEDYYIESQEVWSGLYGEFTFAKGEIFDINKLELNINKLDTGLDLYEWGCQIHYQGKVKTNESINKRKRIKRLRIN